MAYDKNKNWYTWKANQLIGNFQTRHKKINKPYTYLTKRIDYAEIIKTKLTRCEYCDCKLNKTNFSVDHKIPLSHGGDTSDVNLAYCCNHCNSAKGEMLDTEYKELIKMVSTWKDKGEYVLRKLRAAAVVFRRRRYK